MLKEQKQYYQEIDSFGNIDRKEIQDETWDRHGYDKWKTTFTNAIDRTVEKYKKPNLSVFMS